MTVRKNKPRYTTLKIKVVSLAAEIRLIRREEKERIDHAHFLSVRLRLTDGNVYTPAQINRIVKRAKQRWHVRLQNPMTDDARDNALSTLKAVEGEFSSLRGHNVALKKEARAANLAYGFLRGTPFKSMEKYSHTAPPIERTEYHVLKFRGLETEQQVKQRFAEWVETAADWKKPKAA